MIWDEIFRVRSHWANLEVIKFWTPTPLGMFVHTKDENFDSAMGDTATEPPAWQLVRPREKFSGCQATPTRKGVGSPEPKYFPICDIYAPDIEDTGTKFAKINVYAKHQNLMTVKCNGFTVASSCHKGSWLVWWFRWTMLYIEGKAALRRRCHLRPDWLAVCLQTGYVWRWNEHDACCLICLHLSTFFVPSTDLLWW